MESRSLQCQHMEHVRIASPRMERYTIVLNLLITGEKVMKNRRIISLILSVLLVCVMALPASADSTINVATHDGCEFSMYTICNPYNFSTYMEFQSIYIQGSNKTYNDYQFRSDVIVYCPGPIDIPQEVDRVFGTNAVRISVTSKSYDFLLRQVRANHYVNDDYVTCTIAGFQV